MSIRPPLMRYVLLSSDYIIMTLYYVMYISSSDESISCLLLIIHKLIHTE